MLDEIMGNDSKIIFKNDQWFIGERINSIDRYYVQCTHCRTQSGNRTPLGDHFGCNVNQKVDIKTRRIIKALQFLDKL